MAEYFKQHFDYINSLSFEELEKCVVDWSAYRVPFNFREKLLAHNPQMSEEEFEQEFNSNYKTKSYHYNYRHPAEMTEENLRKTYVNLCTHAFFTNKEKSIRTDKLEFDSKSGQERDEVMFNLQK